MEKTLREVRTELKEALAPKYGAREATAMARLVLTTLKGWDFPHLLANEEREAGPYITGRCREILAQLMEDVPVQYALGQTTFYGLTLKVGPGVLVPRPETEELVDLIVKENQKSDLRVLDMCTGSGAIALALARNLPFSRVDAFDLSPKAVETARENDAALKTGVNISREDVFKMQIAPEAYDIIVSNPPYVDESEKAGMEANVLAHEPAEALFVPDDDPLVYYRRIATLASEGLAAGGRLYLEINPRHSSELRSLLEKEGFKDVEIINDVHGAARFAVASKD